MMKLRNKKRGLIGVDLGTSTVKVAQVERSKQGWRLVASTVVPRQQHLLAEQSAKITAVSSLNELRAAQSLQEDYQGRQVAASLPMSLCDIHRLECDLEQEPKAEQLLQRTIETATQQSVEHLQYDFWSSPAVNKQPAWSQALTIPTVWTDQICDDIAQAGWACQAIDGLPLTLARAVNMIHPIDSAAPVAALDFGNARATFCCIEKGQVTYVRCLKNCHTRRVLETLIENLNVTEVEAQRLLETHGLSATIGDETNEIAQLINEILSEMMHQVVEEIQRTTSHFKFLRRTTAPQQIYLLGGGAMIRDLDAYLAKRLGITTENWCMPNSKKQCSLDHRADCLLASAISLSALAWEES